MTFGGQNIVWPRLIKSGPSGNRESLRCNGCVKGGD